MTAKCFSFINLKVFKTVKATVYDTCRVYPAVKPVVKIEEKTADHNRKDCLS